MAQAAGVVLEIEKVVSHNSAGRIERIVETHRMPEKSGQDAAALVEHEATLATWFFLEALAREALEHPERAKKPLTVTFAPFGSGADYTTKAEAIAKRLRGSALLKLCSAIGQCPAINILLDGSPTDAVARPD